MTGAPLRPFVAWTTVLCLAAAAACASSDASVPLANTFESPEQLARAVVDGIERTDRERLMVLALTEAEFKAHVWPRLPASRPGRHVPFEFVWTQLYRKSLAQLGATLATHGGTRLDVLAIRFRGETTDYGTFVVNRDAELVVRDAKGRARAIRLFGSVLRQGGRYKLFSYVVD